MAKDLSMRELSLSTSFASSSMSDDREECDDGGLNVETKAEEKTHNVKAMMLASKFAASTRKGAQKTKMMEKNKLQKPHEPDFSADSYD